MGRAVPRDCRRGLWSAVLVALVATGLASAAAPRSRGRIPVTVSANWVGYVAVGHGSTSTIASTSMRFTHITGRWVQPRVTCTPGDRTSVAIWVGLGGFSETSQALEQTGTSADCSRNGKATYTIWYEVLPANSVYLASFVIHPGDVIVSAIKVSGHELTFEVIDRTRKTIFSKRIRTTALDLTSAEWIAEAPSECDTYGLCKQLPLANFDRVKFSRSSATGNGASAVISSARWNAIGLQLESKARRQLGGLRRQTGRDDPSGAGAYPSRLSRDGSDFTAAWNANTSTGG